jgi:hypothetical protein
MMTNGRAVRGHEWQRRGGHDVDDGRQLLGGVGDPDDDGGAALVEAASPGMITRPLRAARSRGIEMVDGMEQLLYERERRPLCRLVEGPRVPPHRVLR